MLDRNDGIGASSRDSSHGGGSQQIAKIIICGCGLVFRTQYNAAARRHSEGSVSCMLYWGYTVEVRTIKYYQDLRAEGILRRTTPLRNRGADQESDPNVSVESRGAPLGDFCSQLCYIATTSLKPYIDWHHEKRCL